MTIRYSCTSCGSVLKIKDELAGTPGKCPKCKSEFTVPQAAEVAAPVAAAKSPPAAAPPAGPEDEDFDPVAFLMADGGQRTQTAPHAVPPPPAAAPKRNPVPPAARRPDADERPPAPRRDAAGPTTAAETADAMLRTNASANAKELLTRTMEESRVRAAQMPVEDQGEPRVDYQQLGRDLLFRGAPIIVGAIVVVVSAYWLGNYMSGGGRKLPDLARVSGTVTKGGAPLAGASVYFTPMDVKAKTAFGMTDENGAYTLIYDEDARGAVVGKNRVEVSLIGPNGRDLIEGAYSMADAKIHEVKPGSQTIDLTIP
jgi:hypothetical protein